MGADLIGYLVVGPAKLPESTEVAFEYAVQALTRVGTAAVLFRDGEEDRAASILQEFGDLDEMYVESYEEMCDIEEAKKEATRLIENIYDLWNSGSRDSCWRFLPNGSKVLFAGDQTWGDSPDGFGYTALLEASRINLLQLFDIQ